jgi:hypothetical protein
MRNVKWCCLWLQCYAFGFLDNYRSHLNHVWCDLSTSCFKMSEWNDWNEISLSLQTELILNNNWIRLDHFRFHSYTRCINLSNRIKCQILSLNSKTFLFSLGYHWNEDILWSNFHTLCSLPFLILQRNCFRHNINTLFIRGGLCNNSDTFRSCVYTFLCLIRVTLNSNSFWLYSNAFSNCDISSLNSSLFC